MSDTDTSVVAAFTKPEALVLFDLLSRSRALSNTAALDRAEEHALNSLCALLEKSLSEPFDQNYARLLTDAKRSLIEKFG